MPFSAAEETNRRTKSVPTGPRADEEAAAQRQSERCRRPGLERANALPRALDASPHRRVEHAAARDLEAGEAGLVQHLGDPEQLPGRDLPRERLLREQADSGVDQARHEREPTELPREETLCSCNTTVTLAPLD